MNTEELILDLRMQATKAADEGRYELAGLLLAAMGKIGAQHAGLKYEGKLSYDDTTTLLRELRKALGMDELAPKLETIEGL